MSENASLKGEVKLFYGDVEACQYDLCKLVISDPLVVWQIIELLCVFFTIIEGKLLMTNNIDL